MMTPVEPAAEATTTSETNAAPAASGTTPHQPLRLNRKVRRRRPRQNHPCHSAASRNQAGADDDSGRTDSRSGNHFGNQRCPGGFRNDSRTGCCA